MSAKVSAGTIIRTICLVLALTNMVLESCDKKIIPISDDQVSEVVTLIFTIVTSCVGFWKNNSFTEEAIIADDLMHELKEANAKDGESDG